MSSHQVHCFVSKLIQSRRNNVYSLCFTLDQSKICTGGQDRNVRVWNLNPDIPGDLVEEFIGHTDFVSSCEFSPSGEIVATGSGDKSVRIWKMGCEDGEQKGFALNGHKDITKCVKFNEYGSSLLSTSRDGSVRLRDLRDLSLVLNLEKCHSTSRHPRSVNCGLFIRDQVIVTGGGDANVNIWDLRNHNDLLVDSLNFHKGSVNSVCFHEDSYALASAGSDKIIRVYDIRKPRLLKSFRPHTSAILEIDFHPSGNYLVSSSAYPGHGVKIIDLVNEEVLFSFTDKEKIVVNEEEDIVADDVSEKCHGDDINCVRFSTDGKFFATGSDDENVLLWQTNLYCPQHIQDKLDVKERLKFMNLNLFFLFGACSDTKTTTTRKKKKKNLRKREEEEERKKKRRCASYNLFGKLKKLIICLDMFFVLKREKMFLTKTFLLM